LTQSALPAPQVLDKKAGPCASARPRTVPSCHSSLLFLILWPGRTGRSPTRNPHRPGRARFSYRRYAASVSAIRRCFVDIISQGSCVPLMFPLVGSFSRRSPSLGELLSLLPHWSGSLRSRFPCLRYYGRARTVGPMTTHLPSPQLISFAQTVLVRLPCLFCVACLFFFFSRLPPFPKRL
jgi:hypothetical protein